VINAKVYMANVVANNIREAQLNDLLVLIEDLMLNKYIKPTKPKVKIGANREFIRFKLSLMLSRLITQNILFFSPGVR
jgi:hypothetical protein